MTRQQGLLLRLFAIEQKVCNCQHLHVFSLRDFTLENPFFIVFICYGDLYSSAKAFADIYISYLDNAHDIHQGSIMLQWGKNPE